MFAPGTPVTIEVATRNAHWGNFKSLHNQFKAIKSVFNNSDEMTQETEEFSDGMVNNQRKH